MNTHLSPETNIGDEGVKALGEALKFNSLLQSLSLGGIAPDIEITTHLSLANSIGVDRLKALGEALKFNSSLQQLNLDSIALILKRLTSFTRKQDWS